MLSLIRNRFLDKSDDFIYRKFNHSKKIELKENSGLYIHIPFCKNTCPYCPYIKTTYNKELVQKYKNALLKEIDLYYDNFGKKDFTSLYIGGGTPTLMLNELDEILNHLYKSFNIKGDIAIETSPDQINIKMLKKLKQLGVNMISLGIQSFDNRSLKKIGRKYDLQTILKALGIVNSIGFDSVNIDLIFAIENQTIGSIKSDLQKAISYNINQITCYPLFTFPFTEIGKIKQLKKLKLPNHSQRKKMYYFINNFLNENGYSRTNVWSFINNTQNNYSSVTRDYYLGLGTSSGSYNGEIFYFNTFSIPEYIKSVNSKLPISISMNISKKLEKYFWLYWQIYNTTINKNNYKKLFHSDLKKDFGIFLNIFKMMGFIENEKENIIKLNTRGSHWIHLVQNYYALEYVNKIWSVSKTNPWPDQIKL